MLIFRSAIADWNHVPSGSMLPSIQIGDRIIVDKLAYDLRVPFTLTRIARWGNPARGDIITFESPEDGRLLVKRVVGIPGDVVAMRGNRLSINGVEAGYEPIPAPAASRTATARPDGDYPAPSGFSLFTEQLPGWHHPVMLGSGASTNGGDSFPARQIPPGRYLVLGDNRDNSRDSRVIGLIARDSITGRATQVAFSLDAGHFYLPRSGRFLADLD